MNSTVQPFRTPHKRHQPPILRGTGGIFCIYFAFLSCSPDLYPLQYSSISFPISLLVSNFFPINAVVYPLQYALFSRVISVSPVFGVVCSSRQYFTVYRFLVNTTIWKILFFSKNLFFFCRRLIECLLSLIDVACLSTRLAAFPVASRTDPNSLVQSDRRCCCCHLISTDPLR